MPTTLSTVVQSALVANAQAVMVEEAIRRLVDADFRQGLRPSPNWTAYEAASSLLHQTAVRAAEVSEVGTQILSADGPLVLAEIPDRCIGRTEVVLTSDGLPYVSVWHEGPESSAQAVMVERWTITAGVLTDRWHGFIDPASRKIVQAG